MPDQTPTPQTGRGYAGQLADPEVRRRRAAAGGRAGSSLDAYVRRVVRLAPELTPDQIERLRAILPPPEAGMTAKLAPDGTGR